MRDVFRRLLDAVDPELVDAAEAALAAEPGVIAARSVKMRWIGHRIHADAELTSTPPPASPRPTGSRTRPNTP